MITPRLQSIVNMASKSYITADIGTDHAYIPIELVNKNIAERAVASDVRPGPLEAARKNIEAAGLCDVIETRLGSGLEVLKNNEAEQIIIAGMGGELIESILKGGAERFLTSRFILQPMNTQAELRRFLISGGFAITGEDIAAEGFKVYNVISVCFAKNAGDTRFFGAEAFGREIDYHLPPYLRDHELYGMLFAKKQREFEKIVSGLERSKFMTREDEEKLEHYKGMLNELPSVRG